MQAALWGGGLVVCLVIVVVVAWLRVDSTHVRTWLAEKLSEEIGKTVRIAGPVSWALSLEPAIILHQITIAEPSDRHTAILVEAGTVQVSLRCYR